MAREVAPYAGVWIETSAKSTNTSQKKTSPPTRGRGLKRPEPPRNARHRTVAPYAGAWIETFEKCEKSN